MSRLAQLRGRLPRVRLNRETLREDAVAGVVLGVESVPDGLAGGLLAAVNPVYGLYAYMVGTFTGALFTSSAFMAVQATGAMAIVVADVGEVHDAADPERALFTLSILTGAVMLIAGLFRLGTLLRWVSNAVMVGFINAVGVNIVLGQFDNFTGYEGQGANRVFRALDTVLHLGRTHLPTVLIGIATIALILVLERGRLGPLGLVVAIVVTSTAVALFGLDRVATLNDITDVPNSLPLPRMPLFGSIPGLLIPAAALAFVGLVQGAGISANFTNPDGRYPDASRDFVGQGAANVAAGLLQGMPVGGSMSASSLVTAAGAKSRQALIIAGGVMAIVVLIFGGLVGYIAMPALAGLLMLVGYRTVKPADLVSVWKTGNMQAVVLAVTFLLTMIIPLQNAVVAGVGISVILYVIRQSNQITIRRRRYSNGDVVEEDPPAEVPPNEAIVLQPYGSMFFATASTFEEALPAVTPESRNSVVIIRLRGRTDLGSTLMEVLARYAQSLRRVASRLMIISSDEQLRRQLAVTGVTAEVGTESVYESDEWVGATVRRAYEDARAWIASNQAGPDRQG